MKKSSLLLLSLGLLLITACDFSNANTNSNPITTSQKDSIIEQTATKDSMTTEIKNAEAELKSFLEKD